MRWRGFYAASMIGCAVVFGLLAYTSAPKAFPIALLAAAHGVRGRLPAADDRRLPDRLLDARRRRRDHAVVAVHQEHVERASRSCSSTTSCSSTRSRCCWRSRSWRGSCTDWSIPTWHFWRGRMFWPMMVFTAFVVLGLLRGRLTGGDTRVAIFEGRRRLYLPIVYLLVTNLLVDAQPVPPAALGGDGRRVDPEHLLARCTTAACRTPSGTSWRACPSTRRRST